MISAEIQREILLALSDDPRGLDQFQVAATTGQAPVRVRAELTALKRHQLIRDTHQIDRVLWLLTPRGREIIHAGGQPRIA